MGLYYTGRIGNKWKLHAKKLQLFKGKASSVQTASETREQLWSLHQEIHGVSVPGLLEQYEKLIENISFDLRAQRLNVEKLESILKRTEETTALQMVELEEDLQHHLVKVEHQIREEEQQRLEATVQEMQRRHKTEISELQARVARMAKHKDEEKAQETREESARLKNQIYELSQENSDLKLTLLETQTNISLLQTDLDRLKNDFADQQAQHEREKLLLKDMIDESTGYSNQIQLLNEANKSLYDSNDSMRYALTNIENEKKRHSSPNPPKDAPVITYSSFTAEDDPYSKYSDVSSWANRCKDSGVSLPRSLACSDIDCSASDFGSEHSNSSDEPWEGSVSYVNSETETMEARSEVDGRIKWTPSRPVSRSGSTASSKRRLPAFTPKKEGLTVEEGSQTPSPIYRLVLAGDAGSGKSSFILRLCLNEFRGDIPTTLGVDFQMKKLLVDGDYTTLQIWDTAGQERFRSIAKSYFRKAHGVLLMYDVTSESSFLNVRQWIDEIKDSCDKPIPLMLIGNKTDLRTEGNESGIQTSIGEKLAMAYSSLFCETSAKDGTNVVEAVLHLAREVKKSVDVTKESPESVTKLSIPEKKTNCCKI
ncbi:ras and EF-hand domain-containing protein-like isoform X2 [Hyla sarda]|uniref:ras and EF-hand domain-containing protein-like isoform X2 n=1 Tax=Hyla sarda TaxID=327740 RepID=UPI0024C39B01|nr:ras and EF-hand domain-containing protein-like isoform X2 [Hyla sarda]XP_056428027.1 ras and EF-hand domain-containing protein-like isoform X2 [Hyla sarda]